MVYSTTRYVFSITKFFQLEDFTHILFQTFFNVQEWLHMNIFRILTILQTPFFLTQSLSVFQTRFNQQHFLGNFLSSEQSLENFFHFWNMIVQTYLQLKIVYILSSFNLVFHLNYTFKSVFTKHNRNNFTCRLIWLDPF